MSRKNTPIGEPMAYLLAHLTAMPTDCTTWPYSRSQSIKPGQGYGLVVADGKKWYVHVLVCTWYHGPQPEGLQVRHLCGNGGRGCFTPSHLRWGTAKENAADRAKHRQMIAP